LFRYARIFEVKDYLKILESGSQQFSDIEKSLKNSDERKLIDTLNKIKEGPITTTDGINMYLEPSDYAVSGFLAVQKIWEPFETYLFKKFIKKNTVFIDIGAHIGYYSLLCASKAKQGQIISFEPVPANFKIFEKNISLNNFQNINPIKKAISNQNESSLLYLSAESNTGDNRFFSDDFTEEKTQRKNIKILCIGLDHFLEQSQLEPNIIKMDIQGGEMLALKGMKKTLKSVSSLVLFSEFWPRGISATGESPEEFLEILAENEFNIFEINEKKKKLEKKSNSKLIKDYTNKENPFAQTDLLLLKNVQEPNIKN